MRIPILLFTSALWIQAANAASYDRVVATLETTAVTASDVRLEEALQQGLPSRWLPTNADPLERVLQTLLIRQAAGDVAVYQPEDSAVDALFDALRGRHSTSEDWSSWLAHAGQDEDSLKAALRRRLIAERFLIRNLTVAVESDRWSVECAALLQRLGASARIRKVPPLDQTE